MDTELISAIIFYSIIGVIVYINRKRFSFIQGILLAYRTKKPLEWMDKLKPSNMFWKIYSTICIPVGFYFMPQLVYMLALKAKDIILTPNSGAGVALAIPGVRIPGSPIYIPLFYGIISIAVMALVHEMAHGIIGKGEKVKIKNAGFGMLLIFPLFFVEPDEKSLNKASKLSRLRMISAGAGTNIILAYLLMLILSGTLLPFLSNNSVYKGVKITSLIEGYPASKANITAGTVINSIDGTAINNLTGFNEELKKHSPNDTINVNTSTGLYTLTLAINPNNNTLPYMGVFSEEVIDYSIEAKAIYGETILGIIRIIYELLVWMSFLNFSIGIMNLLPIWGLDGSKMLYDLLSYVTSENNAKKITTIISSACLGFLIINILPLFTNLFQ